ncbi:hypothetical protein LTS18_011485, partial [Coniosporium uncinatum]
MDAYDHIQEENYPDVPEQKPGEAERSVNKPQSPSLNTEFQETFKAFSNSPWGARLGGLWGTVKKQ